MARSEPRKISLIIGCALLLFILSFLFGQEEESTMGSPPVVIIGGEWLQHVGDKPFHTEESRKGINHFPSAEGSFHCR